ncbi:MAG: hypothetical protein V4621_05345 [Pseudomonadota bacterium]
MREENHLSLPLIQDWVRAVSGAFHNENRVACRALALNSKLERIRIRMDHQTIMDRMPDKYRLICMHYQFTQGQTTGAASTLLDNVERAFKHYLK